MTPTSYGESLGRLPREMVAHVRALASGEATPAEPRHAATVVLLRDAASGLEAYLLRRQKTMAFAAGMHVFPGGSVDPRDEALPDDAWVGPPPGQWAPVLTADEQLAKALVCAAVRETFEESGVLLAGSAAGDVVADTTAEDWEADRLALLDRSLSLAASARPPRSACCARTCSGRGRTGSPPRSSRGATTPGSSSPRCRPGSAPATSAARPTSVTWARPEDVLAAADRGEVGMLPPTAFTLAELGTYATVADVLAAGDARDLRPVLPKIVVGADDEARLLLPAPRGLRRVRPS